MYKDYIYSYIQHFLCIPISSFNSVPVSSHWHVTIKEESPPAFEIIIYM